MVVIPIPRGAPLLGAGPITKTPTGRQSKRPAMEHPPREQRFSEQARPRGTRLRPPLPAMRIRVHGAGGHRAMPMGMDAAPVPLAPYRRGWPAQPGHLVGGPAAACASAAPTAVAGQVRRFPAGVRRHENARFREAAARVRPEPEQGLERACEKAGKARFGPRAPGRDVSSLWAGLQHVEDWHSPLGLLRSPVWTDRSPPPA
jgi:hypothetical protein